MAADLDATEVQRLRLQPGDHIILTPRSRISPSQAAEIRRAAEDRFPGYPVTVLTDLDISVLSEEEAA